MDQLGGAREIAKRRLSGLKGGELHRKREAQRLLEKRNLELMKEIRWFKKIDALFLEEKRKSELTLSEVNTLFFYCLLIEFVISLYMY